MSKKFDNLLERAVRGNNLVRAYHSVLRNKGAAGVDGVKTKDLPRFMLFHWQRIKGELLADTYRAPPVRGVKIPKPKGGTRQVGIPTTIDRLKQQALHQVLSPIWERHFTAYSYGFRPKRPAHQALDQATAYINAGRHWIIDLDLKAFFDRVNRDKLMGLLSCKEADKKVLRLKSRYLRSGMMQGGITQMGQEGTPQGGQFIIIQHFTA